MIFNSFVISGQTETVLTFSDAEETINDSELPDFKEDGIDVEMHLADRYIHNILFNLFGLYVNTYTSVATWCCLYYYSLYSTQMNGKY